MQWFDPASNVTFTIDFDAVESEAPTFGVTITEYPVELGASLIDFVRPEPITLRLTTYVSNAPARMGLSHLDDMTPNNRLSIATRQPVFAGPPSAALPQSIAGNQLTRESMQYAVVRTWSPFEQKIQRVEKVYAELKRAMYEAREFTVFSALLGDFDRMLLKSLRTDRGARSGNAMRLEMELQQVTYAELEQREVSGLLPKLPKKPANPKSEPAADAGKVTTEDVDPKTKRSVIQYLRGKGRPPTITK